MKISNNVPDSLKEIIMGVLLGDGTIKMNGHHAVLSIQQTDEAIVDRLWSMCNEHKLVNKKYNVYIVLIN